MSRCTGSTNSQTCRFANMRIRNKKGGFPLEIIVTIGVFILFLLTYGMLSTKYENFNKKRKGEKDSLLCGFVGFPLVKTGPLRFGALGRGVRRLRAISWLFNMGQRQSPMLPH